MPESAVVQSANAIIQSADCFVGDPDHNRNYFVGDHDHWSHRYPQFPQPDWSYWPNIQSSPLFFNRFLDKGRYRVFRAYNTVETALINSVAASMKNIKAVPNPHMDFIEDFLVPDEHYRITKVRDQKLSGGEKCQNQ
jgi:hypothetical protein